MRRILTLAAISALTFVPASPAQDIDAAQNKALAIRAAKADAYRKLAETIKGLQINATTTVRDFVTESDDIRASMDELIKGVRLGEPTCFEDGVCEVPAEVTVERVVQALQETHRAHYKGDRLKSADFEQINRHTERNIIKVVGQGAPREDLPPGLPGGVIEKLGGPPPPARPTLPPLWQQIGGRARLNAERAARVDAMRQLVERIKGVRISSDTVVRDFMTESDRITAQAMATLVGATEVSKFFHADEPIVEVTMEVPLESVVEVIKRVHSSTTQGGHIKGLDVSEISRSNNRRTFQATGMGIPDRQYLTAYNQKAPPQMQVPPWAMDRLTATGECPPPDDKAGTPQGRLLAARCAEIDAKRRLGEHIHGLSIQTNTTVRDVVAANDFIQTVLNGVLVGAVVEKTEFNGDTALVTVSIPGMAVWDSIHAWSRSSPEFGPR